MTLPLQIAFLTGQSDRSSSSLSPAQSRFLDALPVQDASKVRVNFPYPAETPPYRDTPIPRASWSNIRQTVGARRAAFRQRHREAVLALLARADRTLFLAGSCGLELLGSLELEQPVLSRLRVFAYGPVALRIPECGLRVVCARGDWISRLLAPAALVRKASRVEGGHLGYLADPQVAALCRAYVEELQGS